MMDERQRREVQKKLEDEERLRRLEEAGYENARAPWETEERAREARREEAPAGRSTNLASEEARLRREREGRGELTGEEMRRSGSDRTDYPAGTGSYYSETFVRPTGRTSPESSFNEPYREREPPSTRREELSEEEMRRSGEDRTDYPAGTGSYYSETFVRPYGRASPESEFNEPYRDRKPPARRARSARPTHRKHTRELTEEEMRRSGADRTNYPAGTGSYYSETFVQPYGRASPESYFNEPYREREPPARRTGAAMHRRRTEHHPVKKTRARRAEAPPRPVAARQERFHRELMYEQPRESAYRETLDRPIHRTSPFDVRSSGERYETVRYTETVPERFIERYEIRPGGEEKYLGTERIETPRPVERPAPEMKETARPPAERGVVRTDREWQDPREAGRLRGRARSAMGGASEGAQRYGTEAVHRSRDLSARISEWGRGASERASDWGKETGTRARQAYQSRDAEDTAYNAGTAIGSAIRKVTSVSRELSSGFREGMGPEYPEGRWEEARDTARSRYREEEATHHERAREGWRYPEEEEAPHQAPAEAREKTSVARGEVRERAPSKRTSTSARAKRAVSTTKRKMEETPEEDWQI